MTETTEVQALAHRITAAGEGNIEPAIPILKELAFTPYACSSVEQVSGGVVNFTFRGFLSNPLPDGSSSVIIKHSKDFSGFMPGMHIQADRCVCEQKIAKTTCCLTFPSFVARRTTNPSSSRKWSEPHCPPEWHTCSDTLPLPLYSAT